GDHAAVDHPARDVEIVGEGEEPADRAEDLHLVLTGGRGMLRAQVEHHGRTHGALHGDHGDRGGGLALFPVLEVLLGQLHVEHVHLVLLVQPLGDLDDAHLARVVEDPAVPGALEFGGGRAVIQASGLGPLAARRRGRGGAIPVQIHQDRGGEQAHAGEDEPDGRHHRSILSRDRRGGPAAASARVPAASDRAVHRLPAPKAGKLPAMTISAVTTPASSASPLKKTGSPTARLRTPPLPRSVLTWVPLVVHTRCSSPLKSRTMKSGPEIETTDPTAATESSPDSDSERSSASARSESSAARPPVGRSTTIDPEEPAASLPP